MASAKADTLLCALSISKDTTDSLGRQTSRERILPIEFGEFPGVCAVGVLRRRQKA
jgi:hypothetical protein